MCGKKIDFKKSLDLKKKTIRSLFLYLEKHKDSISTEIDKKVLDGMVYVQMRLPVDKITDQFEQKVKDKVEANIYQAKIRAATEKDLEIIKEIYNKSWLTSNTPFRPIEKSTLKTIFNDPSTTFLIARVYGIDGAFLIIDFEGENNEYGVIAGLGVLPRFQRKGLGTILGLAAWSYLKDKGIKELRCEVYKDNIVSYNFIKGLQFEVFGEKIYRKEDFHIDEH
jgi:ribosomal protein S18 acetylase RimI-like enzyme